jgi:hypothetical protein
MMAGHVAQMREKNNSYRTFGGNARRKENTRKI